MPPRNPYACSLDEFTYEDLEVFLSISSPERLRPAEGLRLDYKSDVPKDLPKTVGAMANTQGGLILLGVAENQVRPTAITGLVVNPRSDLKTQLSQIISSNLDPTPEYEIAVFPVSGATDRQLAVVRVEQGTSPPYLVDGCIYIRRHDRSSPATRQDLDAILRTRSATSQHRNLVPELTIQRRNPGTPGRTDSPVYLKAWLYCGHTSGAILHRPLEQTLGKIVQRVFPEAGTSATNSKGRDHFDLSSDPTEMDFHRRWRIHASGGLVLASQIQRASGGPALNGCIYVYDVGIDILRTCAAAKLLFDHLRIGGRCYGGVLLALGNSPIEACSHDRTRQLAGIGDVSPQNSGTSGPHLFETDTSTLPNAASLVAESLRAALREQRYADVELEDLTASLEAAARHHGLAPKA